MASDFRPPLAPIVEAFGVAGTVTRPAPDNAPIETTVVWVAPLPTDVPVGGELQRQEPLRVMALLLSEVPTVPHGTLIEAPEEQSLAVRTWKADGEERREHDHIRVSVIPVDDAS